MITWQPAPASTWQLCEGQRVIGSVTQGIDGLWRWRRGLGALRGLCGHCGFFARTKQKPRTSAGLAGGDAPPSRRGGVGGGC